MKYKMRVKKQGRARRLDDGTGVRGDTWPDVGALLSNGTSDSGTLHLTLGVDNDTGVVLEVEEDTVTTPPGLALANDDSGHDLLSELGLTLLDGSDNHVTGGGGRETVKTSTNAVDGNDEQVLGTRVVGAVHDGTDWQSQGHSELGTNSGLGHLDSLQKLNVEESNRVRVFSKLFERREGEMER